MLELKTISIEEIELNPDNPRTSFMDDSLKELSLSIKRDGLIEPIVVRSHGIKYELIVGERRVRAAILVDVPRLPAIIRNDLDDEEVSRLRLIENLARKDLSVFERVNGIKSHMENFNLNIDDVAKSFNKTPATIKSWFRLAENTSPNIKSSDKHVRLLGTQKLMEISKYNFETQERFAELIINNKLTVDQIRRLVLLFGNNPDADINFLIKKVKEQVKTIEVTLPIDEAKKLLKKVKKRRNKEKKAVKKLQKYLRPRKLNKDSSDTKISPPQSTSPIVSQPTLPMISQPNKKEQEAQRVTSIEIPIQLPNLKKIRDTQIAKLVNSEKFTAAETSRLQNLDREFPDMPPNKLIEMVVNEMRPRIMVIEIPPKIYTSLELFSSESKIFPKEGLMLLVEEGLMSHGYQIVGGERD